jgi:uncharacterized protein (DUF2147 family)
LAHRVFRLGTDRAAATFHLDSTGPDKMAIRDRMTSRTFAVCLSAAAAFGVSIATAQAADPSGVWLTADQSAKIRVEHCPDGYWGSIDWEKVPGTDAKNPDPSKRGRPLLGTPILIGMKPSAANKWDGKVYNPKEGSYYDISIILEDANRLKLQGCMLFFCGGETWTRAADQQRTTTGAAGATETPKRSVCPQQRR